MDLTFSEHCRQIFVSCSFRVKQTDRQTGKQTIWSWWLIDYQEAHRACVASVFGSASLLARRQAAASHQDIHLILQNSHTVKKVERWFSALLPFLSDLQTLFISLSVTDSKSVSSMLMTRRATRSAAKLGILCRSPKKTVFSCLSRNGTCPISMHSLIEWWLICAVTLAGCLVHREVPKNETTSS